MNFNYEFLNSFYGQIFFIAIGIYTGVILIHFNYKKKYIEFSHKERKRRKKSFLFELDNIELTNGYYLRSMDKKLYN